jgi:putative membrane-bound dehydrogenase-like protein
MTPREPGTKSSVDGGSRCGAPRPSARWQRRSSASHWASTAFAVVALIAGALAAAQGPASIASRLAPGKRVEVLFLGHTRATEATDPKAGGWYHDSDRFAPMLKAALAPHGFNFSYTTDVGDLNATNLAKYDALLIYSNHRALAAPQEKALLDFVADGKGLLALHSAAFCFQNSAPYTALLGAQFARHGTGEFSAAFVNPSHPVLSDLQPFQVREETYVHTKLSPDRTVLMDRAEGAGREPWTWVRTHGKGRVFYTAYGHDEQVWGHPSFHSLMKNAITWAIGPEAADELRALAIAPLQYTDAPAPVPNYERRNPPPKLQQPLSTAEAAKHLQVPPGFELQLFAAEPLITGNPVAMAWDERGRLWLAESNDYPNNPRPAGEGNDVIKILEDTNHDGRADKATVFADKLTIVSSLVFANGGLIVSQAREMVVLKDTNGDDKADLRESLIRGWSIRDTHALASNLKYGLDNWVWGAVGYSGFNGTVGGQALNFNQALYRFSRDGSRMEHMANFTNNTWGLAFNETFDVFGSTANGEHSVHVAIPRPYYDGVSGLTGDGKKKIDGHYAMQANTQKIRQVDVHGGFTAAAGHNFYTARAFPEEYWNRVAFVNEPTGHVVHRAIVERQGSGFAEKDGWNVAASDDEWFAPVHAEVGPDGALWILDFYDFIIQHNPTPIGPIAQDHAFQNGIGNAYDTPLREHDRGRIYRLVWKGAKPYTPLSLDVSRPLDLVQALRHDNMFWRTTAQRLIVERGKTDVVPGIIAVVNDRTVDRIGLNSPAVHALWTLHGLGALDGTNAPALDAATRALSHPAAGVRKAALSVLPTTQQSTAAVLSSGAVADTDLNVRLNALLALSRMPASVEAGRAIYRASTDPSVMEDEWLPEAVWIAATKHEEGFLKAYADEVGVAEAMKIAVRGARGERGGGVNWSAPSLPDADWTMVPAPRVWSETAIGDHVGTIWLRKTIEVPTGAAGKAAEIRLGIVDDSDVTYVNGVRIGATMTSRNLPRQYSIPPGVLTAGVNVIAVRISNVNGRGGFVPDLAPAPGVSPLPRGSGLAGMAIGGEGFSIRLEGDWRAKVEEAWDGARRREIVPKVPIAQQFLLANSPVAGMLTPAPASLPAGAASPSAGTSSATSRGALAITIGVISGQMKFTQTAITARRGQRVEITLANTDDMPHNIVIFRRGTFAEYEKELFGSLNEPNAQLRGFVPDSPNVLVASRLLNAGESTVVTFDAPTESGEYPFVCSFPGHWATMRGVLKVE